MTRVQRVACSAALLVLFTSAPAWAQGTAELNGRVTDESGAVLPGVTVTATQTDTGFSRTNVTDAAGSYLMPNLPIGPYRLEVALQGFRTYVQTGIVLQVGATPTINAVLGVGSLEETDSVEAAAPIVDVRSAGISEVVENARIVELPLQGRQVTDLILLAGAAVQTGAPNNRSFQGGVFILRRRRPGLRRGLPPRWRHPQPARESGERRRVWTKDARPLSQSRGVRTAGHGNLRQPYSRQYRGTGSVDDQPRAVKAACVHELSESRGATGGVQSPEPLQLGARPSPTSHRRRSGGFRRRRPTRGFCSSV